MTPTLKELLLLFNEEKFILIDAREKEEWEAGHVDGAVWIPLTALDDGEVPEDLPRDKPLYVHCRSGNRATKAANILKHEYPNAQPMDYGFSDFKEAGFPTA